MSDIKVKLSDIQPQPTKKSRKCTKVEALRRKNIVYQMICQGANNADIRSYAVKEWGMSYTGADHYCHAVRKWIQDKIILDMEKCRAEANLRFDTLFQRLFKEGQYYNAGMMQVFKNKINGLETLVLEKRETVLNINFNMPTQEEFEKSELVEIHNVEPKLLEEIKEKTLL